MLEVFDGFIAALNTETNIPFIKESDGKYSATVNFEEKRKQLVRIELCKDESDDLMITLSSSVCLLKEKENPDVYRYALELNNALTYAALTLKNGYLTVYRAYFLRSLDPQRFIKSLLYVAAKADELEEAFTNSDVESG